MTVVAHATTPKASDFSRVTTRYMIEARAWACSNPTAALRALAAAVVRWDGSVSFTYWLWRGHPPVGGTAVRPGHGRCVRGPIDAYARQLAAWSGTSHPKGQGPAVSWSRSRHNGRFDDECLYRTGIFLDSDGCGGWGTVRTAARSVGLAFVGQMRPIKPANCHIEIPLARHWVPVPGPDGTVARWKSEEYCPRLGYVMGIFGELGGLRFDPAWDEGGHASAKYAGFDTACDQLTQLNYLYTRRPDDPAGHVPVTDHNLGGALDIDALLAATAFADAQAVLSRPLAIASPRATVTRPAAGARGPQTVQVVQSTPSLSGVVDRLLHLRKPETRKLVAPLLAGRSYAPLGERNATMFRIASVLAAIAPEADPAQLARLFTKSLIVMAKEPGAQPAFDYVGVKLTLAAKQIRRAQRNGAARDGASIVSGRP